MAQVWDGVNTTEGSALESRASWLFFPGGHKQAPCTVLASAVTSAPKSQGKAVIK